MLSGQIEIVRVVMKLGQKTKLIAVRKFPAKVHKIKRKEVISPTWEVLPADEASEQSLKRLMDFKRYSKRKEWTGMHYPHTSVDSLKYVPVLKKGEACVSEAYDVKRFSQKHD